MSKYLFLFLSLAFVFVSCGDDDPVGTYLNYDDANNSAPILEAGTYTAAARFPAFSLSGEQGKQITEIDFYLLQLPSSTTVKIYGEGTGTAPGSTLYSKNVTIDAESNGWNTHVLDTPVTIDDQDLWIAVEVVQDTEQQTIGCDLGPAVNNGDFFNDLAGQWTTLRDFSNDEVSINWNIRAKLSE